MHGLMMQGLPHGSIHEIADHWAPELQRSPAKVRNSLIEAWWRGELVGCSGPTRVAVLQLLYREYADPWRAANAAYQLGGLRQAYQGSGIVFVSGTQQLSELMVVENEDGRFDVDEPGRWQICEPPLIQVPIPSQAENSWTEDSCEAAFESLAAQWECLAPEIRLVIEPVLMGIKIPRDEFLRCARAAGFKPKFWNERGSSASESKPLPKPRRQPSRDRAERAILELYPDRRLPHRKQLIAEVNIYLVQKDRYGVSDDTIDRAVKNLDLQ